MSTLCNARHSPPPPAPLTQPSVAAVHPRHPHTSISRRPRLSSVMAVMGLAPAWSVHALPKHRLDAPKTGLATQQHAGGMQRSSHARMVPTMALFATNARARTQHRCCRSGLRRPRAPPRIARTWSPEWPAGRTQCQGLRGSPPSRHRPWRAHVFLTWPPLGRVASVRLVGARADMVRYRR